MGYVMKRQAASKDPLGPIDFIVGVITTLLAVVLIVVAIATAFGSVSVGGLNARQVWAQSEPGVIPYSDNGTDGGTAISQVPGAQSNRTGLEICTVHPGAQDRVLSGLMQWPSLLFTIGFLLGLRVLIRTARRDGLFTAGVARRLDALGWYLLAGAVLVAAIQSTGGTLLLRQLVKGVDFSTVFIDQWSMAWSTLIGAFGLITLGRVMRQTVDMREELDATV